MAFLITLILLEETRYYLPDTTPPLTPPPTPTHTHTHTHTHQITLSIALVCFFLKELSERLKNAN